MTVSLSNQALWQQLDATMQAAFNQVQQASDPLEPWRDWDESSCCLWYDWCADLDILLVTERLQLDLWRQLSLCQGAREDWVQWIPRVGR